MHFGRIGRNKFRPLSFLPPPGHAAHRMAERFLRLQDSAGAEGVAALQRQAVIENMEHPGHGEWPYRGRA